MNNRGLPFWHTLGSVLSGLLFYALFGFEITIVVILCVLAGLAISK